MTNPFGGDIKAESRESSPEIPEIEPLPCTDIEEPGAGSSMVSVLFLISLSVPILQVDLKDRDFVADLIPNKTCNQVIC